MTASTDAMFMVTITDMLAFISLVCSVAVAFKQLSLSKKQEEYGAKLASEERVLSQRQMFVTIWPYISELRDIDADNPVEADVIKAVNSLELVAACWEAGVVDKSLIERTFSDSYMHMYDAISRVGKMQNGKTGDSLLRAAPAVDKLYGELREKKARVNAPLPLSKAD